MRTLILLAILGTALAAPKVSRIVGGSATTVENYPFMSNMQYGGLWAMWWYQACGGSLITSTSVLSSATCYEGDSPFQWKVRLGSSFASSGGVLHDVAQLIIHPQFNTPRLDNDVSIVRLSSPATFSNSIRPVGYAPTGHLVPDNTELVALGWGALSLGGQLAEQLHEVNINVINQTLCTERYDYLKIHMPNSQKLPKVTDGMFCAGILDVGGKDACQGDSGGPLIRGNIVVGITSWGYECGNAEYPGVNARVSKYSSWIAANV